MIKIERHEQKVSITIEHGAYWGDQSIICYWNCGSELYAQLLTNQLEKHLHNRENQFWNKPNTYYSLAYKERMQKFVSEMADSRRVLIDLIK